MYIYIHVCNIYIYIYVYVYICIHIYIYIRYVHIYIYVYIYVYIYIHLNVYNRTVVYYMWTLSQKDQKSQFVTVSIEKANPPPYLAKMENPSVPEFRGTNSDGKVGLI